MKVLYLDSACFAFADRSMRGVTHWEPHCARIAAILADGDTTITDICHLIRPEADWLQKPDAVPYHKAAGIDFQQDGVPAAVAATALKALVDEAELIVSFNAQFHQKVVGALFTDATLPRPPGLDLPWYCAMAESMPVVKLPTKNTSGYKPPKLTEAYKFFSAVDLPNHVTWHPFGVTNAKAVRLIYRGLQKRKEEV